MEDLQILSGYELRTVTLLYLSNFATLPLRVRSDKKRLRFEGNIEIWKIWETGWNPTCQSFLISTSHSDLRQIWNFSCEIEFSGCGKYIFTLYHQILLLVNTNSVWYFIETLYKI